MVNLIPVGPFERDVLEVHFEGTPHECISVGWKPSTPVSVPMSKCIGHIPEEKIGKRVQIEFDPDSEPAQLKIQSFRFLN